MFYKLSKVNNMNFFTIWDVALNSCTNAGSSIEIKKIISNYYEIEITK